MSKREMNAILRCVSHHGAILAKGLVRTLYGSLTAGLLGVAVATFMVIPAEGGYAAVCDFIAAVATLLVALWCVYAFGQNRRRTNKNK